MRYLLSSICCVFFFACSRGSDQLEHIRTLDFNVDKQTQEVSFFDLFERIDLIPLETSDSSLLSPALIIAVHNDTTYVMDFLMGKNIKIYDSSGKFISLLCRKGDAPDDYIVATNISINPYTGSFELLENNNILSIYDLHTKKKTGKLKLNAEHFSRPTQQCFALGENEYAAFSCLTAENNLLVYNTETGQKKLRTKPTPENIIKAGLNYTFTPFRIQPDGTITLSTLTDRSIYKYENDMLVPYIVLDFGKKHNMDSYIFPDTPAKDIKNILNDNKANIVSGIFPHVGWQDKFLCTIILNGENHNLYANLQTGENICFKTTAEGVTFSTGGFLDNDGKHLYTAIPMESLPKYVTEEILDEKNRTILHGLKEDDNPVILRYELKK